MVIAPGCRFRRLPLWSLKSVNLKLFFSFLFFSFLFFSFLFFSFLFFSFLFLNMSPWKHCHLTKIVQRAFRNRHEHYVKCQGPPLPCLSPRQQACMWASKRLWAGRPERPELHVPFAFTSAFAVAFASASASKWKSRGKERTGHFLWLFKVINGLTV